MTQAAETTEDKPKPVKRRLRWLNRRVVLVGLILLTYGGWRYGWPTRSWETTICPLEEIDWQEAVRLAPECISAGSVNSGARNVLLAKGSHDESGTPVFKLEHESYIDPEIISLNRKILPTLKLPGLSGKGFRAGVFWVDMPVTHQDEPHESLSPSAAYSVLLMCKESQRWEDAAVLIVDLNRNRDLTDDPVMRITDTWSHDGENPHTETKWHDRVFDPITLSRTPSARTNEETLPAEVRALPTLGLVYMSGEQAPDTCYLAFCPTSFRKGRLLSNETMHNVVVSPDRILFGRFDGPAPGGWNVDKSPTRRYPLTSWKYERGTFWGCTLDADGSQLRDGPYSGPTGTLGAETADGQSLRIMHLGLWLRGDDLHRLSSRGWAPVPRFSSCTLPVGEHPLPVGDYGMSQLTLTYGWNTQISVESLRHYVKASPRVFSIQDGQTTVFRLPKTLKLEAYAKIEERPRPHVIDWAWSSTDPPGKAGPWKGPRPGSKVKIGIWMSDPATDFAYSIHYLSPSQLDLPRLAIKDPSGKTLQQTTMEYG